MSLCYEGKEEEEEECVGGSKHTLLTTCLNTMLHECREITMHAYAELITRTPCRRIQSGLLTTVFELQSYRCSQRRPVPLGIITALKYNDLCSVLYSDGYTYNNSLPDKNGNFFYRRRHGKINVVASGIGFTWKMAERATRFIRV